MYPVNQLKINELMENEKLCKAMQKPLLQLEIHCSIH